MLYLLVMPALLASQSMKVIILSFLLMHLVQSVSLFFTFFMTHHVLDAIYPETDELGVIQTSWLRNQISSSNDMHPFSETANFLLGGFNNHVIHHLFPHTHYPRLNRILKENGITPNQTTYIGGVISHLRLLKKLSKRTSLS